MKKTYYIGLNVHSRAKRDRPPRAKYKALAVNETITIAYTFPGTPPVTTENAVVAI